MILILGFADQHCDKITSALEAMGEPFLVWNTASYPFGASVSYQMGQQQSACLVLPDHPKALRLEDIQSVYWYYYLPPHVPEPELDRYSNASITALMTVLRCLGDRVINAPASVAAHRFKTHQLKRIKQQGIRTPDTLITNNPHKLREFSHRYPKGIVFKNLTGIGYPQLLKPKDIDTFLDDNPIFQPGLAQELIEGLDIRVHIVGDDCFASEIHSEAWTFVADPNLQIKPHDLPESMEPVCRQIRQTLGYQVSGIDFRKTVEGDYVCIEANPSPQFGMYEEHTGQPIGAAIARLLVNGPQ